MTGGTKGVVLLAQQWLDHGQPDKMRIYRGPIDQILETTARPRRGHLEQNRTPIADTSLLKSKETKMSITIQTDPNGAVAPAAISSFAMRMLVLSYG